MDFEIPPPSSSPPSSPAAPAPTEPRPQVLVQTTRPQPSTLSIQRRDWDRFSEARRDYFRRLAAEKEVVLRILAPQAKDLLRPPPPSPPLPVFTEFHPRVQARPRTLESLLRAGYRHEGTPRVSSWAVGVVTTKRKVPTITRCLNALVRAGWSPGPDCHIRLFVDAGSPEDLPPEVRHFPMTCRAERVYSWPNYHLGLLELYDRHADVDAFLMLEDDAILYANQNVRSYLEKEVLWPTRDCAVVNLYTASPWQPPAMGWFPFPPHRGYNWGALAFIFSNDSVRRFLASEEVLEHRQSGHVRDEGKRGLHDTDILVGQWLKAHDYTMWLPSPSLVEHVSEGSTVWDGLKNSSAVAPRGHSRNCHLFVGDFLDPKPHELAVRWIEADYYRQLRREAEAARVLAVAEHGPAEEEVSSLAAIPLPEELIQKIREVEAWVEPGARETPEELAAPEAGIAPPPFPSSSTERGS